MQNPIESREERRTTYSVEGEADSRRGIANSIEIDLLREKLICGRKMNFNSSQGLTIPCKRI